MYFWKICDISKTFLFLTYKNLGENYDRKKLIRLLKKEKGSISYFISYHVYELLEDTSYLESAYNQVQEKASAMEDELAAKFLNYPIPKAIVE